MGQAATGALANCLCEPETAAFMFGALGTGNAPLGQGPVPGFNLAQVLTTCNSLGFTGAPHLSSESCCFVSFPHLVFDTL